MKKVIFKRNQIGRKYEEEFEFDDNVTEEEIQAAYEEWVWQEIGDNFTWYIKE